MKNNKYILFPSIFLLPYIFYGIGLYYLIQRTGGHFNSVIVFTGYPDIGWQDIYANILVSIFSLVISYIMPGLPWVLLRFLKKGYDGIYAILAKSFLLSLIMQIALGTLYKLFLSLPLTRASFTLILFIPCILGVSLLLIRRKENIAYFFETVKKLNYGKLAMSLLFMVIIIFYLKDKLIIESFNDDGVEIAELTQSLARHIFPYWDFEQPYSSFGWVFIAPPLVSFLHFPIYILLGKSEFAMRLPHIACFFILPMIIDRVSLVDMKIQKINRNLKIAIFGITLLGIAAYIIISCFYIYNNHYHHSDLTMNIETFLITFAFIAIYFLFKNRILLFLSFSLIASFVLWYAVIFFTLFLFVLFIVYRRNFTYLLYYPGSFILLFLILGVVIYMKGYLFENILSFKREYSGYLSNVVLAPNLNFLLNKRPLWTTVFYYTGGLLVMMPICFKKNKFYRLFVLTFLSFFYFIFTCIRNPVPEKAYVFSVVAFFPLIILLHHLYQLENKKSVILFITGSYLLLTFSLYKIVPHHLELKTYPKELGKITYMDFERYEDAVSASKVMLPYAIQKRVIEDRLSGHSWVYYSDLEAGIKPQHTYYLTSKSTRINNKEYKLLLEKNGYYLFLRHNPQENKEL